MTQYNKFWIALAGVTVLVGLQIVSKVYQIDFTTLTQVVTNIIVGAATAGGVYLIPNKDKE